MGKSGEQMSAVAIITARGGSKRIPHKNIRDFCGKPIIAYSIEAAIESEIFDEVMVSTDDMKIAEISREYGAVVPFMRSSRTSDDYSSTYDVICEVVSQYSIRGRQFQYICCIYPIAPFITPERLRKANDILKRDKADMVYPVTTFSFPPQRGIVIENDGMARFVAPQYSMCRSQDLERIYHDCGQFYFARTDKLISQGQMIGENAHPIIVNELEQQDIDNETDWKIAEIKYKLMKGMYDYIN